MSGFRVKIAYGYCFIGRTTKGFQNWRSSPNYKKDIEQYKFNKYDLIKPYICIDDETQIRFLKDSDIVLELYSAMIPMDKPLTVSEKLKEEVRTAFNEMINNPEIHDVFRDVNNWELSELIFNVSQ